MVVEGRLINRLSENVWVGFGESNKAQGGTAGLIPAGSYYTTRPGEAGEKQLLEPRERQNVHYGAIDKYWDLQLRHAASSKPLCWETVNKIDISSYSFSCLWYADIPIGWAHLEDWDEEAHWFSLHRLPSAVRSVNSESWKGKQKPGASMLCVMSGHVWLCSLKTLSIIMSVLVLRTFCTFSMTLWFILTSVTADYNSGRMVWDCRSAA